MHAAPDASDATPSFDADTVVRSMKALAASIVARVPYLLVGLIVLGAGLLAARVAGRLAAGASRRAQLDSSLGYLLSRLASTLVGFFAVLAAAVVVFPTLRPGDVLAGLGITSVAIGFALKDVLQNFFAGVLILWRRPFHVGDQIRSGEYEGTVEEIDVRSTRLKTYDGERVVLPNGDVYTRAIVVRTAYDRRRVRFTVGVGYPDDLERARATIAGAVASAEGVLGEPGPWVYVSELAPSSVNFAVYFWAESHQANVLRVSDRVATAIKLALDGAGVDMPFPHTVVLFHDRTGSREGDAGRAGREREAPSPPAGPAAAPPGGSGGARIHGLSSGRVRGGERLHSVGGRPSLRLAEGVATPGTSFAGGRPPGAEPEGAAGGLSEPVGAGDGPACGGPTGPPLTPAVGVLVGGPSPSQGPACRRKPHRSASTGRRVSRAASACAARARAASSTATSAACAFALALAGGFGAPRSASAARAGTSAHKKMPS